MRRLRFEFAGSHKRFAIERSDDHCFHVRDAHAITDDQIRRGERSPVVAAFNTLAAARRYCESVGGESGEDSAWDEPT